MLLSRVQYRIVRSKGSIESAVKYWNDGRMDCRTASIYWILTYCRWNDRRWRSGTSGLLLAWLFYLLQFSARNYHCPRNILGVNFVWNLSPCGFWVNGFGRVKVASPEKVDSWSRLESFPFRLGYLHRDKDTGVGLSKSVEQDNTRLSPVIPRDNVPKCTEKHR